MKARALQMGSPRAAQKRTQGSPEETPEVKKYARDGVNGAVCEGKGSPAGSPRAAQKRARGSPEETPEVRK